jgi:sporulation protein YlmC with PRC-barrel domain
MAIDGHTESADLVDRGVLDRHGEVIGTVVDVYEDALTGRAKWLVVSTGYFGTRRAVAPVQDAALIGDDVVVAYPRDVIDAAPHVHTFTAITPSDERTVSAHYALHQSPRGGGSSRR